MSNGHTRDSIYQSDIPSSFERIIPDDQRLIALNQRLEVLNNYLPTSPYLLAIQSKRQFHLSDHQGREVSERDCGFRPEERELQYLSFLRTGWDNTILTVLQPAKRVNRADKSKVMASAGATSKTVSKKMSIADYKKRSSLPPNTATNGSLSTDETRNRAVSSAASLSQNSSSLKRSADTLSKPKPSAADEPPTKKLKPSPNLSSVESKSFKTKISLPPPLSPTLPAFVERLLARSEGSPSKEKRTEPAGAVKKIKQQSDQTKGSPATNSSNRPHDVDDSNKTSSQSTKTTANGIHRSSSNSISKPNRLGDPDTDTIRVKIRDTSQPPPSVILRLKIPRERRKDVSRLIKLPPKRIKEQLPISKPAPIAEKMIRDKSGLGSKTSEKRPREDENLDVHPDRKRSKSPAQHEKITGKKPRESTPVVKEEVTTPQAAITIGTPVPPSSSSRLGHKHTPSESGSTNSYTSDRLEGLQKLQQRYSDLGRTLKKEGDKLSGPDMSPSQKKKFIASRIEVTLAFMLCYTIGDEVFRLRRRPLRPEATWGTIFVWMRSVHDLVHDHPHLSGLLLQLEAISIMVVWRQKSELAENSENVSLEKFKELRAQCEESQRKFLKGSARLSVDDLQEEFPKTWKMKARQPLATNMEYKMTKDNLNGEFYLPLTSISLPIEGVRAGKTLLAEWCRREGVEWVAKLDF